MWDEPDHFNQLLLSQLSSDTNDRDFTIGTADNRWLLCSSEKRGPLNGKKNVIDFVEFKFQAWPFSHLNVSSSLLLCWLQAFKKLPAFFCCCLHGWVMITLCFFVRSICNGHNSSLWTVTVDFSLQCHRYDTYVFVWKITHHEGTEIESLKHAQSTEALNVWHALTISWCKESNTGSAQAETVNWRRIRTET
jgi:hypothetical protein